MAKNLTTLEAIMCFLNGAHLVWRQRVGPGSDTYRVYLPGGLNPDKFIGRISSATFMSLMSCGFLESNEPPYTDNSGDLLYIFRFSTPSLPYFVLDA